MQIVIDVPEEIYNMSRMAISHPLSETNIPLAVICNGTPLPEHGRLVDADALKKAFVKNEIPYYAWEIVKNAPTILEGTK